MINTLNEYFQTIPFFSVVLFGNTISSYIIAFFGFLGCIVLLYILKRLFLKKIEGIVQKTTNKLDDEILKIFERIPVVVYLYFAFYISVEYFLPKSLNYTILDAILIILIVYEIMRIIFAVTFFALNKSYEGENATTINGIKLIVKIVGWSMATLFVLSNLGFNISALMASLGIGGIAVALAAQNILGDLFSSFSIYFDKPFQEGDYIVIGTESGTVQKIGLKTTRLKTLRGEELVISNNELIKSRIQNLKKLKRRRINFSIGVEYSTTSEKLAKIPDLIKSAIDDIAGLTYARCFFKEFGDFSLQFEFVYFVEFDDYESYARLSHILNLAIVKSFHKEKIVFAFPTQTIHLSKS